MPAQAKPIVAPQMSDGAVQAKTGKTWPEWFAILDKAGAQKMTHQQIVAYLVEEHNMPGWWQQMVTVGYEQARGLRAKHEKPDGFLISVSKTLGVPAAKAFHAWHDARTRARWLPGAPMKIRKATPDKSMRVTWGEHENLSVDFYAKGEGKCQVVVQHEKLPNAEAAAQAKAYWGEALGRMKALVEK
jgi:uncharacterized protein YndB with AHSA1/START domain